MTAQVLERKPVSLDLHDGRIEVEGLALGPLAVTNVPSRPDSGYIGGWTVTHVQTGRSVAGRCSSRKRALECMRAIMAAFPESDPMWLRVAKGSRKMTRKERERWDEALVECDR